MKKLSNLTMLLAAFLALTSFVLRTAQNRQRRGSETSSFRSFAMPPAISMSPDSYSAGYTPAARLRKRLRPWRHGHPLRQ